MGDHTHPGAVGSHFDAYAFTAHKTKPFAVKRYAIEGLDSLRGVQVGNFEFFVKVLIGTYV